MPKKPTEKPPGSDEDEFEKRFEALTESGASPSTTQSEDQKSSDRLTPIYDEPVPRNALPSVSVADVYQGLTQPPPQSKFQELLLLSRRSSSAPENPDIIMNEVAEVVGVITGVHPGLKPSPVPRMYVEKLDQPVPKAIVRDDSPSIEVTGSLEINLEELAADLGVRPIVKLEPVSLDQLRTNLYQCKMVYMEMGLDFSSIYRTARRFKLKKKRFTPEQATSVIHSFFYEITRLLTLHLIEGKTEIVQTKMGQLAGQLLPRIAEAENSKVVCDPANMARFQLIKQLVEVVPPQPEHQELAELFIRKLDFRPFINV